MKIISRYSSYYLCSDSGYFLWCMLSKGEEDNIYIDNMNILTLLVIVKFFQVYTSSNLCLFFMIKYISYKHDIIYIFYTNINDRRYIFTKNYKQIFLYRQAYQIYMIAGHKGFAMTKKSWQKLYSQKYDQVFGKKSNNTQR